MITWELLWHLTSPRLAPTLALTYYVSSCNPAHTIAAAAVALCQHAHTRWYVLVVRQLQDCPMPEGTEGEEKFSVFLSSLLRDHTCVPQALSRGVLELQERLVRNLESACFALPP